MRLLDKLYRFWNLPEGIEKIKEMLVTSAQSAEQLAAKVSSLGEAVGKVAVVVTEGRAKVAELSSLVAQLREGNAGDVDPAVLGAITASVDATLDQLAKIVNEPVADQEVPTGEAQPLPESNPETPAPVDVLVPPTTPDVATDPSEVADPPAENPVAQTGEAQTEGDRQEN